MTIADAVEKLRRSIEKARQNAPLAAPKVALLGASKGQPVERVEEAIKAGLTIYGENRVQDAWGKWPELKKRHSGARLHLIGPLQTNKVKEALALFDVIQTVDRPKLAEAVASHWSLVASKKSSGLRLATRDFYIQVNTGEEPQKAGVMPHEADALIAYCRELKLPVTGLMCIPPAGQPPAPHFALLRQIAARNGLSELSMGMSEDYETAVRMGSTCVRIGRALFGERS